MKCIIYSVGVQKILAHASKFPSSSVNGVLIGEILSSEEIIVKDAIPLCHTNLSLAPAIEIGLAQIQSYIDLETNLKIVGYYHSDSKYESGDLPPVGRRIADKIQEKQNAAVSIVLDNKKLSGFNLGEVDTPLDLFIKEGARGWKRGGTLQLSKGSWNEEKLKFHESYKVQKYKELDDFEGHLDDIRKDYLNKSFT